MADPISPESLPEWPRPDLKAKEVTLLACLLGRHGDRDLTGEFGRTMLLYEALRHAGELVELLAKLRSAPTSDDWKNDLDYSTSFDAPLGFIVSIPGVPDTPFLSLTTECQ